MPELILKTEALTKKYGRRLVVDQLSLAIESGDIFGFLGQNGAGKSTTIRMLLGLVRPTHGRVFLLGLDMARHPLRALHKVGAIVESPAFYENFSGRDNLRMLASLSGGVAGKRIDETLELVGLLKRGHDPVRTYSHGMRQRLGIAQALLPNPEFIILDEPTNGLDPQGIREIRLLLPQLRDKLNLTILLSSHLLHEVEHICNKVAIIDQGRLLYQGAIDGLPAEQKVIKITVDEIERAHELLASNSRLAVRRNGSSSLYVTMGDEDISDVNAFLVANGIRVVELSPQRATLEQVFLELTKPVPAANEPGSQIGLPT